MPGYHLAHSLRSLNSRVQSAVRFLRLEPRIASCPDKDHKKIVHVLEKVCVKVEAVVRATCQSLKVQA